MSILSDGHCTKCIHYNTREVNILTSDWLPGLRNVTKLTTEEILDQIKHLYIGPTKLYIHWKKDIASSITYKVLNDLLPKYYEKYSIKNYEDNGKRVFKINNISVKSNGSVEHLIRILTGTPYEWMIV